MARSRGCSNYDVLSATDSARCAMERWGLVLRRGFPREERRRTDAYLFFSRHRRSDRVTRPVSLGTQPRVGKLACDRYESRMLFCVMANNVITLNNCNYKIRQPIHSLCLRYKDCDENTKRDFCSIRVQGEGGGVCEKLRQTPADFLLHRTFPAVVAVAESHRQVSTKKKQRKSRALCIDPNRLCKES